MDSSNKSLCFFLIVAVSAHFWACENPMENPNSSWDPPSEWYFFPRWSPTGEWIAYEYYGIDSLWGIWLVRPDGSENRFETRGILPDFSPDGKKLALSLNRNIYVYDLETKELTQLTFEGSKFFPDWSPDGTKIAYYSNAQGLPMRVMDADGENKKPLVPPEYNHGADPKWLSNHTFLFIRGKRTDKGNVVDVFAMDTTGRNEVQLTQTGEINEEPRVSPDGKRIVWQRLGVKKNREFNIWLMNADGSGQVRLTDGFEPDWLPDSRHIIYRKRGDYVRGEPYDEDDPKVHGSLWIMNVDTKQKWQFLPKN